MRDTKYRAYGVLFACQLFSSLPTTALAGAADCPERIAPKLRTALAWKFPELRIPSLSELNEEVIAETRSDGRDDCYSVATGDFGGGSRMDTALLMVDRRDNHVHLIAAIQQTKGWRLYELPSTYCESIDFCYVFAFPPGTYERTPLVDGPLAPGEQDKISSRSQVIQAGTHDSTGIVYAYQHGRWRYVWVSD